MQHLGLKRRYGDSMSKRKLSRIVVVDVFLVVFWAAVLLFELLYTQNSIWVIVAFVGVFVFSALLGRDIKKQRMQ
jgi:hypothetical protein